MLLERRDAEAVALLLLRNFPDVDPAELEFPELSQMILELPGVRKREGALDTELLEAIQVAWSEKYQDDRR